MRQRWKYFFFRERRPQKESFKKKKKKEWGLFAAYMALNLGCITIRWEARVGGWRVRRRE